MDDREHSQMTYSRPALLGYMAIFLAALTLPGKAFASGPPQFEVLRSFNNGADGSLPQAPLIADRAGNLYGTTSHGGGSTFCNQGSITGCGTVFMLIAPSSPAGKWTEQILYIFTGTEDGSVPFGGLVLDAAGNLYGTTSEGGDLSNVACTNGFSSPVGCGVIFELSPSSTGQPWTESVLYTFEQSDGASPNASLVFDSLGNLYGTTSVGGNSTGCGLGGILGCGVVFELSPSGEGHAWQESVLYSFAGHGDGGVPQSDLVFDQTGNLYSTTLVGGAFTKGVVFELIPPINQGGSWTEVPLYSFQSDGIPRGGVILDAKGNLFGTTSGTDGNLPMGTVFELSPSSGGIWTETVLYSFGSGHSATPWAGLISDSTGNLYGTTIGKTCGSLFRLQKAGSVWKEAEYDFFHDGSQPCAPEAKLVFGKWGAIYGTSVEGGTSHQCGAFACGTVFAMRP